MGKKIFAHLKIFAVGNLDCPQPASIVNGYLALYKGGKIQFVKHEVSLFFIRKFYVHCVMSMSCDLSHS